MKHLNILIILVLAILLTGCGKSALDCGDKQVSDLVIQIMAPRLNILTAAKAVGLTDVTTVNKDKGVNYCTASLLMDTGSKFQFGVKYTSGVTDDGHVLVNAGLNM